ncbi:methylated-DNA--[protein]-cysteine S-methyltransferase [Leptothoe spongobia]|uniref:Methylated-DNA--protein-cysteine methyltransferase n=1 Tax=Leptothoe spongobia TAU-MAC 1115 TaxID=1967444 RepID=A0A947DIU7_9CYAN|nr:methylated-DNA--[protein]-cysteine S-methyltransferase [Leptothoe spongobia]MBT9317084.1 methylated-DNA--[protein]-cysteine S-methyltransferase [Leptothoe spongobia TAU-MAC 1115]
MAKTPQSLSLTNVTSPIGNILLVTDGEVLVSLDYEGYEHRMMRLLAKRYGPFDLVEAHGESQTSTLQPLIHQIQAYLAGDLTAIDHIPVNPGGTAFQANVWQALRSIPPGTVMSYGELARRLGNPAAVRAVGTTNSLNPISIVLPCHRVIGANGSLTGYAGGLDRKRWLLEHEGVELGQLQQPRHEQQLSFFDK